MSQKRKVYVVGVGMTKVSSSMLPLHVPQPFLASMVDSLLPV